MTDRHDARPQFNPKYRIAGAIVVVVLAVIIVPLILDEREPPPTPTLMDAEDISVLDGPNETKIVVSPVEEDKTTATGNIESESATTPAPVLQDAPKPPSTPKPAPASEEKSIPASVVPSPKTSAKEEKITSGWIVQVGTFTHMANATRLRDKLEGHGHRVTTETVTVGGKKAMRLRAGPYRDKDQAVAAQVQIRQQTKVEGVVQSFP